MKRLMYSGTGLLVLLLAFLAFNMASSVLLTGARLDLTEQKLYTISDGTRQILRDIDEPITLYFFFSDRASKDMVMLRNYARRVEEMLKEYERVAGGKLRLQIIDPQPFSEAEDRAAEFGLQAIPLSQTGDKLYFGLAGTNSLAQREIIPFFTLEQEGLLEYELSRLVNSLSQPEKPQIGLISGLPIGGGMNPMSGQPMPPWTVLEQIRQLFTIQSLEPDLDEIPEDIEVLLLIHPKSLTESALFAVDQFVLRGGRLLSFIDPYAEMDISTDAMIEGMADGRASDLGPLLAAWGVDYDLEKVVVDTRLGMSVSRGQGQLPARHIGWLELEQAQRDSEDTVTAPLQLLTIATGGALKPIEGASTRFMPLLSSTASSALVDSSRFATLQDPEALLNGFQADEQIYHFAARLQGPASTAYPQGLEGREPVLTEADNINVLLVADTDLLSDRMWVQVQDFFGQRIPQPWADNGGFLINALDNLSGSEALISVRSRGDFSRPFTVVQDLQRKAERRFRASEQRLQQQLAETERRLAELQQNQDPTQLTELSSEQQEAIQRFLDDKLEIRKQLRDVRFQLNADIERLGNWLKVINIGLVPLLLSLGMLGWWLIGRWRRKA
ncbi:Gldg family protein [Halopseudomonas phragmitis]|uniref:ABC transporter n=2 Tax=Pseudomonadaceae TaxID=135621 RepID=A0A1V0B035_9GAMM|nr:MULTISPECIES: Gldg family protein [Pseudomonadaceae]AQZ93303.1 ABC transporter [Halopseudomonas phragmitis]RHW21632.1 ABC transporter [Pseudomonas jilinensis]